MDAFVHDPLLRKQLSMLTGYVGDLEENTSANSMIALFGYYIEGGYRPVGGTGALAQRMVERLQQYGGEARSLLKVESIMLENGKVNGVKTKKGNFYSTVVISNVDPRVTYECLVGMDHLPTAFQKKIQELEPSMSLFVWTAAIDRPFFTDRLITYILSEPMYVPHLGVTVGKVGIHSASALDSSLAPKGKGTITIFIPTRAEASKYSDMSMEEYTACKQEIDFICRLIIKQIDPEAERSILFSELATPKTMQKYLQTYQGSVYNIRQQEDFPEMKTPLPGLYLVGAGVGYGPGIEAVLISGGQVAEHLKPIFSNRNQVISTKLEGKNSYKDDRL
ncbi:MAG TPA: hypothetical protein VJ824_08900 [Bacillota bacterium]|nr:hypothetical protein [Bacillota bacterium]